MSLLASVIIAHKCRSTHHRIAMDALSLLSGSDAERWRGFFLAQHDAFLKGAKAPDTTFKDFKNHVCHVGDGYWGGAPATAQRWYGEAVERLRAKQWADGAYALGVLSHYYADPVQPFHTGQTEEEGDIHRAVEWSIAKSYDVLKERLITQRGGYPAIALPTGPEWVADMVRNGAEASNPSYDLFIDHYDVDAGVKDPPAGLDDAMRDAIADLIGHATVGVAHLIDRARAEAGVTPPAYNLTVRGYLASVDIPVRWITRKMADAGEARTVKAMYDELQTTGRVEKTLSDDDTEVRALHAKEVLKVDLETLRARPKRKTGAKHGAPETPRARAHKPAATPARDATPAPASTTRRRRGPRLAPSDPIVDAPSIGPKTAARLNAVGVETVADLLALNTAEAAAALNVRHIKAETLEEWRDQARLVCTVPGLAGHDAQILTAVDVRTAAALAEQNAETLYVRADAFAASKPGQRIVRSGCEPTPDEVKGWIAAAREAKTVTAA